MRAAGLVEQLPDPSDGRARLLALTARGDAMVDAAIEIGTAYERRLAADLGADAGAALRAGLEHVVASPAATPTSPPAASAACRAAGRRRQVR